MRLDVWQVSSCLNSGRRNIRTRTSWYSWQNFWLLFVKSRIKMSARRPIIVPEIPLFFSVHLCIFWNWNSNQATTTSFQILFSTLFAVHPVIRCCVILTSNKCKWVRGSLMCWIHARLLVEFCKIRCSYFLDVNTGFVLCLLNEHTVIIRGTCVENAIVYRTEF